MEKNKIIFLFFFVSYLLNSCSRKDLLIDCQDPACIVDQGFCSDFKKAIHDIQFATGSTSFVDRQNAMFFFNAVTGIKSRANDYHHPVYESQRELRDDLRAWKQWFEQHRCQMTKVKADSLIENYRGG